MTVFDASALHRLVDDVDGRCFLLDLARTYRRMVLPRADRLVAAVVGADADEAMDAALSLKVSSTMVGASELSELALVVEGFLRTHDLPGARAQVLLLPAAAQRVHDAIGRYLLVHEAGQASTDSIR